MLHHIAIFSTDQWHEFAEANFDALVAEVGSVDGALVKACQGGLVLGGGAAPAFLVTVMDPLDLNTVSHRDAVHYLAAAFSQKVRYELDEHLDEIIKRNHTVYKGTGACATHDFCDANMLMAAAFEEVFGFEPVVDDTRDLHIPLWNEAWERAIEVEFDPKAP